MRRHDQHTRRTTKRRSIRRPPKKRHVALLTKRQAKARQRAQHAFARVRRGESLSAATRAEHVSLRTALKHIGKYLRRRRTKSGKTKYVPIKSDHPIGMFVLTPLGYVPRKVRSSAARSLLGKHSAAVQKFLRTGDGSVLATFRGKRVAGRELITDPQLLSKLAEAGALRLDDLYAAPTGVA